MQIIIVWIVFTLPACAILSKKNRGFGYYLLAILFPLIGLIIALCLKKLNSGGNTFGGIGDDSPPPSLSDEETKDDNLSDLNDTITQQICNPIEVNEGIPRFEEENVRQSAAFCSYCGTQVESNALFCTYCGRKVRQEPPMVLRKRIWPGVICGLFLLLVIGMIVNNSIVDSKSPQSFTGKDFGHQESSSKGFSEPVGQYNPGSDWTEYEIAGAFTLSVPNTMELREEDDSYTRHLHSLDLPQALADAIFQQKNLSLKSPNAYATYCRILARHFPCAPGEVERYDQASCLSQADKEDLKEIVDGEVLPGKYVELPIFRWITIGRTKAIEAVYARSGDKGSVKCRLYLLQNYNEMVKIVVAYRECDADLWKDDLENVIRTFKWNNPQ
ncbi:MAG: zinc ribbon domain-containing protein [Bacteroides sp.]|nr:zinc ribbon domain-containing protein [Bacteroides sp.]MCM1086028.1 zinc ribbon domain-containing protein [Bacteroides sp.]